MSNQKVSPDLLSQLNDLQDQWHKLTKLSGELHYQKRAIEGELRAIDEAFDNLDRTRLELSNKIQEAFGTTGSVDLNTGEFVPD